MRRRNSIGAIILVVLLAAVIFVFVYIYLSNQNNQANTTPVPTTKSVVQAKVPINPFTILAPEMLQVADVNINAVPEGAAIDPSTVIGKMALHSFAAGQTVKLSDLSEPGLSNIIPYATPLPSEPSPTPANVNRRVVSLAIGDENGVAGQVISGDYIDIMWTQRFQVQVDEPQPLAPGAPPIAPSRKLYDLNSTKLILQAVHVIQVIQLPNPPPADALVRHQARGTDTQLLLLDVTPQEAEVLKFMRDQVAVNGAGGQATVQDQVGAGTMTIVLRNRNDRRNDATTNTVGVTDQDMIQNFGIKVPAPFVVTPPARP